MVLVMLVKEEERRDTREINGGVEENYTWREKGGREIYDGRKENLAASGGMDTFRH